MGVGYNNLQHVLKANCHDPDCELHQPTVIEEEDERLTAIAWLLVGADCAIEAVLVGGLTDIKQNIRDELLQACGLNPDGTKEI